MNNFEFYNPVKVIFGEDSIERLGGCCKEFGQKALIVSYQDRSYYGQLFKQIFESLDAEGVAYEEYYEVTANPTIAQCEEGIKLCKDKGCNVVIGVGGGSVMDCGKMIAAGALYEQDDIRKMVSFNHSGSSEQIPPTQALPTIMIPTLPATGSEMNPTAVVTDEIAVKKSYLWAPDCLYPKYALVNPSLSTTLPKYQTACAAFDTMAHILESYFNGDQTVDLTLQDQLQLGVLKSVFYTVDKVIEEPMNKEYRGTMQWASALALNGWVTSGTYGWAPMHQMAHVLGARYHATHGATLSVMMLAWLRYFNDRQDNKRYVQFAREMFATSIEEAVAIMEAKMQQMGVQTSIEEFGAKREDVDVLVNDVVEVSFGPDGLLASNPPLTKEDIRSIYNLACRS